MSKEPEPVQYAYFYGQKVKGESRLLRNVNLNAGDPHPIEPFPGIDTLLKGFDRTVKRIPDRRFLGGRELLGVEEAKDPATGRPVQVKKFGAYKWITFAEAKRTAVALAQAFEEKQLSPPDTSGGSPYRFFGMYSRNRVEWLLMDLALMHADISSVCLYDTLGEEAFEYIANETKMSAVGCSVENLASLFKYKGSGKIPSLKSIVCFDEVPAQARD